MVVILLTVTLYMRLILVPRASRPRASSLGPGTYGTGSTRKLAVISKAHGLELRRFSTRNNFHNSELKQVTFLTTRTSTGSKVDVFHQSQPLTQSSDVTHAVRVVKSVTCLSSLMKYYEDTKYLC